jgi:hypothetical protein
MNPVFRLRQYGSRHAIISNFPLLLANISQATRHFLFEFSGAIELVTPTQLPLLRGRMRVLVIAVGAGRLEATIAVELRCISILTR